MFAPETSLDDGDASANLCKLLAAGINADCFCSTIRRMRRLFDSYVTSCPAPFIAPGLIVTTEIRCQSELYLPIAEITRGFNQFYGAVLTYPPILPSTPFYNRLSWADVFSALPGCFHSSANPALLLESLLADRDLLIRFLFASFLPGRFYGGFGRYPRQLDFIEKWLGGRKEEKLRCLDAACGTGEDSYGLAGLLIEHGFAAEDMQIEGWTIEPMEVWAAAHCRFPHDKEREARFKNETAPVFQHGYASRIQFNCADLVTPPATDPFDLILCNGLLGGPILNEPTILGKVTANLAGRLAPGGILLAADSFHEGWKLKCPQQMLRTLIEANGLQSFEAGEGLGGLKKDLPFTFCPDHGNNGPRSPFPA